MVTLTINYDPKKVKELADKSPVAIARVSRNMANFIATDLQKTLGASIPKKTKTNVAGFKRIRVKKKLAIVKRNRPFATLWLGGNTISAKYGGRLFQNDKGAGAGKHFFKGSFIATMHTGYKSIFHRVNKRGKLVEDRFPVISLTPEALSVLRDKNVSWEKKLKADLDKALTEIVRNGN